MGLPHTSLSTDPWQLPLPHFRHRLITASAIAQSGDYDISWVPLCPQIKKNSSFINTLQIAPIWISHVLLARTCHQWNLVLADTVSSGPLPFITQSLPFCLSFYSESLGPSVWTTTFWLYILSHYESLYYFNSKISLSISTHIFPFIFPYEGDMLDFNFVTSYDFNVLYFVIFPIKTTLSVLCLNGCVQGHIFS